MTGRQKIEAALAAGGTQQIPGVICYEGIYVRDHWRELTSHPWWYAQSPDIQHQLAWRRDVIEAIGQDWFVVPVCLPRHLRDALAIDVQPSRVCLVNRRTGRRQPLTEPQVGGWGRGKIESVRPDDPPLTVEQIDAAIAIPSEASIEQMRADGRADLAALLLEEFGAQLWPFCHVTSPLWGCYRLWGFEGMMTLIADAAELVVHACDRYAVVSEQRIREAAALGAAGIWIEECLTDMVGPQVFASINVPVMRRIVEAIRVAGMKSMYYYCGDPASRWDLILSIGADAIALEESKKNFTIDIDVVVDRVGGRCAVLGNLDAVGILQDADEAGLRREIHRQIAAGRRNGGRFIMSLGSPVTPGTQAERVRRYCELVRESGAG
jgi:hypothetical protein